MQTFKAFMNTRQVKEKLYMRDSEESPIGEDSRDEEESLGLLSTRLCKHSIHPGNSCTAIDVCPVCLMGQCLASLERIANVWRLVGGPCKSRISEDTGVSLIEPNELTIYHTTRRIWHAEKGRWANLKSIYEQYATEERSWEEDSRQDGFAIPDSVNGASSCMEAFGLAMRTPFLVEGWNEIFVPNGRMEQRSAEDKRTKLPSSSPDPPGTELERLQYFAGTSDRTVEEVDQTTPGLNGANTISSPSNNSDMPPRSPSTSSDSSIYRPSPPPPQKPPRDHLPSPSIFGVSFPEDLPSPSSRRSIYYQRASPFYERGRHASPFGSTWVDTSFMSDSKYGLSGIEEDEDEELNRLTGERNESFEGAREVGHQGLAGFADVDLGLKDEEAGQEQGDDWSDWSDNNNDDDDDDDLIVHTGRNTVSQKRLPDQVMESSIRRPVFSFSRRQHPEAETKGGTDHDAVADEFDDEEAEQAMRDMASDALGACTAPTISTDMDMATGEGTEDVDMVSLVEPQIQASPRRRSHDDFIELEGSEEEDHVKRHCR